MKNLIILASVFSLFTSEAMEEADYENKKNYKPTIPKYQQEETIEDIGILVGYLKKLGVLDKYREIKGDLKKIPRDETVYVWRIDEALGCYKLYLQRKYEGIASY